MKLSLLIVLVSANLMGVLMTLWYLHQLNSILDDILEVLRERVEARTTQLVDQQYRSAVPPEGRG